MKSTVKRHQDKYSARIRMIAYLKDLMYFNRGEQRGILVLLSLIFLVLGFNMLIPYLFPQKPTDFSQFEKEIALFEAQLADSTTTGITIKEMKPQYSQTPPPIAVGQTEKGSSRRDIPMIELNTSDTILLLELPGIGASFSRRIIKYREKLGGYYATSQLLEVYGMDSTRYAGVCEYVRADTTLIRRLDIQKATFKELLNHPYLEYDQVKEICRLRDKKKLKNKTDLEPIVGKMLYRKLQPYLY
ncbi:MAG: helix-hairpin-helix domain-containing protein [Bacteroidetes bacterium]|nr:helix-hairpin-helix domain-containing protein [Bacteroidota bacterium]